MDKFDLNKQSVEGNLGRRLKLADETAMEEVFRLFYNRLYSFTLKVIDSQMDAEDLVQEVMLHFWLNVRDKNIVPDNIGGYLFRMMRNKCLNYLGRQGRMNDLNAAAAGEFYASQEQRMDEIEMKEEVFFRIKSEFRHLTPIQVKIMHCLYVEGLSVADIAALLDTTVNNVRNHKMRALEKLKSLVGNGLFLYFLLFLFFYGFSVMKWVTHGSFYIKR